MENEMIKNLIKYFVIITIIILGKIEYVKAESYEVPLNGATYTCDGKGISSGFGWVKSSYRSADEAKKHCTQEMENYYNRIEKEIYIFDNASACQFEETSELYDCNCNITKYTGCELKGGSNTSTSVAHITFFDANGKKISTDKCTSTTSLYCSVSTPNVSCPSGKILLGWSYNKPECDDALSLYGKEGTVDVSTHMSVSYHSYYACCGSKDTLIATPTAIPSPIPINSPTPIPSTPTIDNPTEGSDINSTIEPSITPTSESHNNDNNSSTIAIIIICIIFICLILLLIVWLSIKKDKKSQE